NNAAKDNDEVNYESTGFGENYDDENGNNNCDNNNNNKSQTNSFTRSRSRSLFTSLSILRVTQQVDNTQGFQNNGLNLNFINCKVKNFF
ncbi:7110_t:CDS:1, partial [Gigaspora margarita]